MRFDFVRNERKPLFAIRRAWKRGEYEGYALMEDREVLAYALFVRNGANYLFDYFAVSKGRRGEGLGTLFLKQLAGCFQNADCIVGEVEDPEKSRSEEEKKIRERRLQFYLRSGYEITEVRSRVFGVDLYYTGDPCWDSSFHGRTAPGLYGALPEDISEADF